MCTAKFKLAETYFCQQRHSGRKKAFAPTLKFWAVGKIFENLILVQKFLSSTGRIFG